MEQVSERMVYVILEMLEKIASELSENNTDLDQDAKKTIAKTAIK